MNTIQSTRPQRQEKIWVPYVLPVSFRMKTLQAAFRELNELVRLVANPAYNHKIKDSIADLADLARAIRTDLQEPPKHVICLEDNLTRFISKMFPNTTIHHLDLSRERNMLNPEMAAIRISVINGKVDKIRRKIGLETRVGIFDTVCLTGGTFIETVNLLRIKEPVFITIGVTNEGLEKLERQGPVVYGFITPTQDIYPAHKLLRPVHTRDGREIPAYVFLESFMPVLKGEQSLHDYFQQHNIDQVMRNPNLFLNAWKGGLMSDCIDPARIVANADAVISRVKGLINLQRRTIGTPTRVPDGVASSIITDISAILRKAEPSELVGPVAI
ncbi:MAG TPA: hypothetical protein VL945_00970 [Candidatus Saccharimonadales bacterium]|nr:hypothetical protein [Candidatus Saccharimonadales bacterium]